MRKFVSYIRATIAGGLLFLIPMMVIIFVISKVFGLLGVLAKPIAAALPFSQVAGVGVGTLITIILLLLVCFLAGIFMNTRLARRIVKWLEERVLVYIPGYAYIHARSTEWFTDETNNNWKPASIFFDDNEVICFVIDETDDRCSIFVPDVPTPSSGSICVRAKDMVTFLPLSVSEAVLMIKQFGKGAAAVIQAAKPTHIKESE